jgi:hypothetical protein
MCLRGGGIAMKRIALGLALVTACSAPTAPDEPLGETTSKISMPACGAPLNEVDGVYAYSNGWAEATGDSCGGQTAAGTLLYQCVEFAQRYYHQRFGTPLVWPVQYAAQMCGANPAGTTVHWVGSGYQPKHGDLIVWQGHTYGHVAVVKEASGGSITIVEQNGGWSANGTRSLSASDGYGYAGCFISADSNNGQSSSATCGYGDGLYCGGNGGGSDPNALYRCTNGTPALVENCANGCVKMPARQNDHCSACPSGFGLYCGGNGISGDANTLYDCQGTGITVKQKCANRCRPMAAGQNDICE